MNLLTLISGGVESLGSDFAKALPAVVEAKSAWGSLALTEVEQLAAEDIPGEIAKIKLPDVLAEKLASELGVDTAVITSAEAYFDNAASSIALSAIGAVVGNAEPPVPDVAPNPDKEPAVD